MNTNLFPGFENLTTTQIQIAQYSEKQNFFWLPRESSNNEEKSTKYVFPLIVMEYLTSSQDDVVIPDTGTQSLKLLT